MKMIKIARGWYRIGCVNLVKTDAYGGDKGIDWIATDDERLARKAHTAYWHGNPRFRIDSADVLDVHNTLRDLRGSL